MKLLDRIKEHKRLNHAGAIFDIPRKPFEGNYHYRDRMFKIAGSNSLLMPLLGMMYKKEMEKEITLCLTPMLGGNALEIKQTKRTSPEDIISIIQGLVITASRMKKVQITDVLQGLENFFKTGKTVGKVCVDATHPETEEEASDVAQIIYKHHSEGKHELLIDGELSRILTGLCVTIVEVAKRLDIDEADLLIQIEEAIRAQEEECKH